MNEENISEIWMLFKEYLDRKQIDIVAEKYVDMLADHGVSDEIFKESLGHDAVLDAAIGYFLDIGTEHDADDWDE